MREQVSAKELGSILGITERAARYKLACLEREHGTKYVMRLGPKGGKRALRGEYLHMLTNRRQAPSTSSASAAVKELALRVDAIAEELVQLKRLVMAGRR